MPDATSGQEPAPADEFDRELRELIEGTAARPGPEGEAGVSPW
ncbi:hypothetical protein [Trebonia sp.]|nr:hypothetical protein [Trebonia sp.]